MSSPILITGVGKRVGFELAKHFLRNDVPVIGTYRSHYQSIDELLALGADLYQIDFYQPNSVDNFINLVKDKFVSLRAVIHNASDWIPENSASSYEEIFEKMMTIHAQVPYRLNLAFSDLLSQSPSGQADIIHLSDYVAQTGSKKHIAYAASKGALENLTLSFAALLAPSIKVNSIAPALIKFNFDDSDDYKAKALGKSLIPREGGYQSVISTVNYLLDSHYVTGRSFALDGGRHLR